MNFVQKWFSQIKLDFNFHPEAAAGFELRLLRDHGWIEAFKIAERRKLASHDVGSLEKQLDEAIGIAIRYYENLPVIISNPVTSGGNEDAELPGEQQSAWRKYSNRLRTSGWTEPDIATLGSNCLAVFRKTRSSTEKSKPVKGLVVGSVQSGKTANMAGVISIAADHGFNLFVILTGVLENLRKQTDERLQRDLPSDSAIKWAFPTEQIKKNHEFTHVRFSEHGNQALILTALKNTTRLKTLLNVIASRHDAKHIKMLIIDDEADQAGINTADVSKDKRTKVNAQLLKLISLDYKDRALAAVNYVGYTATPQATLLATSEDLFPTDFIALIENPAAYLGVRQIAGVEGTDFNGLPIIRDVMPREVESGYPALQESICWFLCCTSAIRFAQARGPGEPVSMLVHTSAAVADHFEIARFIHGFLKEDQKMILKHCESLWIGETAELTPQEFFSRLPDYPGGADIAALPSFSEIRSGIIELLESSVKDRSIEEGEPESEINADLDALTFNGITIAVDNSATESFQREEFSLKRLAYPSKEQQEQMQVVPAYIVVGGATLSRGLTIEGLVCSYFTRSVNSADTLLQMGRWFGYRRGYELYPRIWMTGSVRAETRELAEFEDSLHRELRRFSEDGLRPVDVIPKIRIGMFGRLKVTEPRKQQGAVSSHVSRQISQFSFPIEQTALQRSNDAVSAFVLEISASSGFSVCSWNSGCHVALGVDSGVIRRFLSSYEFVHVENGMDPKRLRHLHSVFTAEASLVPNWNVVLAGAKSAGTAGAVEIGGRRVNKVHRGAAFGRDESPRTVRIVKAIEDPGSSHADIPAQFADALFRGGRTPKLHEVHAARKDAGQESVARLILYAIDRHMIREVGQVPEWREALEIDTFALVVALPGEKRDKKDEYLYVV